MLTNVVAIDPGTVDSSNGENKLLYVASLHVLSNQPRSLVKPMSASQHLCLRNPSSFSTSEYIETETSTKVSRAVKIYAALVIMQTDGPSRLSGPIAAHWPSLELSVACPV